MPSEYWIVKSTNNEAYYLGCGFENLSGFRYSSFIDINDYMDYDFIEYETEEELALELIKNVFTVYSDLPVKDILAVASDIYEWCNTPVLIVSDNDEKFDVSKFNETGSVLNILGD